MPNRVRIGIVGFGRMAREYHLPALKRIDRAQVVAVADTKTRLESAARKHGIEQFFTDYQEMLEKVELDAVLVCTPPWLHRKPVEICAQKGVAVFCEKPMAPTLEDCDAMIAACEGAKVPLYLGFIRRFDPGIERMRSAVQSGELGKVFHVECEYNLWIPDYMSPPYSTILDWARKHLGMDIDEMIGTWRVTDTRVGGGIFQDHGPHYADLLRWILGDEIEALSAVVQKLVPSRVYEDQTAVLFRFCSGTSAFLQIGLATLPGRDFTEYALFHGTKASMKFRISTWWFALPRFFTILHRNKLRKYSIYNYPLNLWRPVFTGVWRNRWMGARQMQALVAALLGELPPEKKSQIATGKDGRKAMEVVLGAYSSSENDETIRLFLKQGQQTGL
jgi:predicted dehydrogenase